MNGPEGSQGALSDACSSASILESQATGRALEPIVEPELVRILRKSSQQVVMRITLAETGAQEQESRKFGAFPEWSSEEIDLLSSSRGIEFIKYKGVNPEDFISWPAVMESTYG